MPENNNELNPNPNSNNRRVGDFRTFEANLRRNRALSDEYLDDVKRRGEQESVDLQRQGANIQNIMQYVQQLMQIQGARMVGQGEIEWVDRQKKVRLENLVNNIVNKEFGALIDTLEVDLDIKLVDGEDNLEQGAQDMQISPQDIRLPNPEDIQDMEDEDGDEDTENTEEQEEKTADEAPSEEKVEVTEDDILAEVDKRKIVNNVTQGSAKNVHRLMHLYKDDIDEIDPRLFDVMDNLIKSQESFEWDPNNPHTNTVGAGRVLKQFMNGYAKLELNQEEEPETEEEQEESRFSAETRDEENEDDNQEENTDYSEMNFEDFRRATLKARAIDIVVLLHESVKVIYEMLGSAGIPEDEEIAKIVLDNTDSLDDEFEDLRYGVYIKRDLLNFVTENPLIDRINNGMEYVWGRMVEMPASDFLNLFKGMLSLDEEEKNNTFSAKVRISGDKYDTIRGNARQIVDSIIEIVLDEEEEYQRQMREYEADQKLQQDDDDGEEWKKSLGNNSDDDVIDEEPTSSKKIEQPKGNDYSQWSQKDIQNEIDRILDEKDFNNSELPKLHSFLK